MSSNSNLSTMQRLVEQLKLEASVERVKVTQVSLCGKKMSLCLGGSLGLG